MTLEPLVSADLDSLQERRRRQKRIQNASKDHRGKNMKTNIKRRRHNNT